jgi:hypothetical protein
LMAEWGKFVYAAPVKGKNVVSIKAA